MKIEISKIKNGQKVIFRDVACMRCNRRDSNLFESKIVPTSFLEKKLVKDRKSIVLVNLKNGSLYTVNKETKVEIIPEKGIAEVL